jgi:hypothetical protein
MTKQEFDAIVRDVEKLTEKSSEVANEVKAMQGRIHKMCREDLTAVRIMEIVIDAVNRKKLASKDVDFRLVDGSMEVTIRFNTMTGDERDGHESTN